MTTVSTTSIFPDAVALPTAALKLTSRCDSMAAVRAAVDNGADCIHLDCLHEGYGMAGGLQGNSALAKAIRYAHDRGREVSLALTGKVPRFAWQEARNFIDSAAAAKVDALLLADPALMLYSVSHHPYLRLQYALPDNALDEESVALLCRRFGVVQFLLPEVLSLSLLARLARVPEARFAARATARFPATAGKDMFDFRNLSREGRNRLLVPGNDIDKCASGERAANDEPFTSDPMSGLHTLALLPQLSSLGVCAIWTDAPQHAPFRLVQVTQVWREALDHCLENIEHYTVKPSWTANLEKARRALPRR